MRRPPGLPSCPLRLLTLAALAAAVAAGASAAPPLAPLSTLGKLQPAPAPGPLGPEQVPVPKGTIFADVTNRKLNQTVDGVTCQSSEKVAFHLHAHLTLFVRGQAYRIPYGIGIGGPISGVNTSAGPFVEAGRCFMWLHTHALDGVIHVEAPVRKTFTLGQFFAVWGVKLGKSGVGTAKGKVTTLYDGKVWTGDPNDVPLTNEAQIQLDVGKPRVAPEHITFPKGLAASTGR